MEKLVNETGYIIKSKLVNNLKKILHNTTFCTVCFDINEELLHLDNNLVVEDSQGDALTLRVILKAIFGNSQDLLVSDYICEPCKTSAWSSFLFISKTKKTVLIYTKYLEQLDRETSQLTAQAIDNEWKKAMIVLNDYSVKKETKAEVTNEYVCDLCGKGYSRKSFMIKHLNKHKTDCLKAENCPHCGFRSCIHEKYILTYNQQRKSKLPFSCAKCKYKFGESLPNLIAHVNKEHVDIKQNTCEECGKAFYLKSHYRRHLKYHHDNKYVGKCCFRKFRSMKLLETHTETCKSSEKPYKCSKYPVLSKPKLINNIHMATHTQSSNERHLKRMNRRVEQKKMYKCQVCNEVLKTKLKLRAHINSTHEKKPNLCLYCNKQLHSREEYLVHTQTPEHRRNIAYNSLTHNCSHCDYSSNLEAMLKAHVNRVHLNVRPFECEHCHKRYFDSVQLNNHVKTHTGERKPKVCDICGQHLAGPTALKKHRRLHTGEKPYSCPNCEFKTNCSSSVKTHIMRKHMGPSIACPLCDHKFHTMYNARKHVKKVHWKSQEKFDYTKLKGLSPEDYEFFRDKRKAVV